MKKVPFHSFEVIQKITFPDGEIKEKIRQFKSNSELKRQMSLFGFGTHIVYELQKHGTVCFDYDECSVSLELRKL